MSLSLLDIFWFIINIPLDDDDDVVCELVLRVDVTNGPLDAWKPTTKVMVVANSRNIIMRDINILLNRNVGMLLMEYCIFYD
jgi:hypothetical protein